MAEPVQPLSWRSPRIILPLLGLLATLVWGLFLLVDRGRYVRSVDCYVQGKITLVSSPIGGRVIALSVNEGDPVSMGEVIATLDTTGDRYTRRHNVSANISPYRTLARDLARKVRVAREVTDARDHFLRGKTLLANHFISEQDLEDLETTYRKEKEALAEIDRMVAADREMLATSEVHPRNRTVFAPRSGQIVQRLVTLGDAVRPSQPLVSLVDPKSREDLWLDAYLRETQVWKVHPGQKVQIRIDSYPGVVFSGHVLEFIPAASQAFSRLPLQNAAGTFVKVVQRVPVRIVFDSLKGRSLYPGMSAEVAIDRRS